MLLGMWWLGPEDAIVQSIIDEAAGGSAIQAGRFQPRRQFPGIDRLMGRGKSAGHTLRIARIRHRHPGGVHPKLHHGILAAKYATPWS